MNYIKISYWHKNGICGIILMSAKLGGYTMGNEYKKRVSGEALGVAHAAKESRLGSPYKGVPIREDEKGARKIIRDMEKLLGLSSWIDNV